jgi:hypothetical protein
MKSQTISRDGQQQMTDSSNVMKGIQGKEWPDVGTRARASGEGSTPANSTLSPPRHALTVVTENADPSLVTQGLVSDKPCLVTVDTAETRHHRRLA